MRALTIRGAAVAIGAASLIAAAPSGAATITPTTTADEYGTGADCSLREAIEAANTDGDFGGCTVANESADTVMLTSGATYARTLTAQDNTNVSGDLDVNFEPLAITVSGGPPGAIIEGKLPSPTDNRVIDISPQMPAVAVSIEKVTLRGGHGTDGGGIRNFGALTLSDSTVSDNAGGNGAGIANFGVAALTNVTISGNSAGTKGGGFWNNSGVVSTLNNVTITNNSLGGNVPGDGGGLRVDAGTLNLQNTIVAGNTDSNPIADDPANRAHDCSGSPTSLGYNLIGNTLNCGFTSIAGQDVVNVSAGLVALAPNSGWADTHALLSTSPAISAGSPDTPGSTATSCATTAENAVSRPLGALCDVGAFESAAAAVPTITDTDPNSPANDNTPEVKGDAEAGSTVRLYAGSDCNGMLLAEGTAAEFASPGLTPTTPIPADGSTSFRVTATNAGNALSACSPPFAFVEDSTAPTTTIDSAPPALTNDATPTLTFSAGEPASFSCQVDGGAPAACASGGTFGPLADGPHTISVTSTDTAGNVGSTAAASFTIDTTGPAAGVSGPSKKRLKPGKKRVRVNFNLSSEPGASFECALDGASFAGCGSTFTARLKKGSHTLQVRARDSLGNVGPATPKSVRVRKARSSK